MKMGNKNSGKRIYDLNKGFFRIWTPQMAYILGFTCADGSIHERTLSWELSNKFPSDKNLLKKFNLIMNSNYPLEEREKSIRLRVFSSEVILDLNNLGVVQNKTKILSFPEVPDDLLNHFIRGFLDGDGWITTTVKNSGAREASIGFSNGSHTFMKQLVKKIQGHTDVCSFNLRERKKITPNGFTSTYYMLEFYSENAKKLIEFLYDDLKEEDLYLERKYQSQLRARLLLEENAKIRAFGKKWLKIEKDQNKHMNEILDSLLIKEHLSPKDIARKLGVSLATLYRWLDKSKVRLLEKRGSEEWAKRILITKSLNK